MTRVGSTSLPRRTAAAASLVSAAALTALLAWPAATLAQGPTPAPAPAPPTPAPAAPSSPAKKELVAKVVQLQMASVEQLARGLVEQPAVQMLREASMVLQERVPADQREAAGKRIQDHARKYVDEAAPLMRERALKLAPPTLTPPLEQNFTEDELRQLVAWLESPVSRKFQQVMPELQNAFVQRLVADARPVIDPKLQTLETNIRTVLNLPASPAPARAPAAPGATGRPAAPAASAAPAARPASR